MISFTVSLGCGASYPMKVKVKVTQLCPTLCNPMDFSRPEYWSG